MGLNTQQKLAVSCSDPKIVCLAGAGTGKTTVLLERISRIAEETNHPENILALTFTNAAAFEMRERYERNHAGSALPEFRTFHSFCYSLLCEDYEILHHLGYNKVPVIWDELAQKRAENRAKIDLKMNLSPAKMSDPSKLTPKEKFLLDNYRKLVKKRMKTDGAITFDELCEGICNLFIEDDPCIVKYKQKYRYIFVDEFQDTDPLQWEFVKSFEQSDIFVCGDALQAIYGFRGADSSIIKELSNSPEWTAIKLNQNYRSTVQICNFANNMSTYADDSYRIEIESERDGDKVHKGHVDTAPYMEKVDNFVLKDIADLIKKDKYPGKSAILFRTNAEVDEAGRILSSWDIDFDTGNRDTDAIHLVESISDNEFAANWLSSYLNQKDYAVYTMNCTLTIDESNLSILNRLFGKKPNLQYRIRTLLLLRQNFRSKELTREQKLRRCYELLNIPDQTDELDLTKPWQELYLDLLESVKKVSNSGVYVGTVHSVKGLEYDNVFLIGPGEYSFPLNREENLNLYYVGITRAKNQLFVYKGDWRDD